MTASFETASTPSMESCPKEPSLSLIDSFDKLITRAPIINLVCSENLLQLDVTLLKSYLRLEREWFHCGACMHVWIMFIVDIIINILNKIFFWMFIINPSSFCAQVNLSTTS